MPDNAPPDSTTKACVICGQPCGDIPRVKDAQGNYVCKVYNDTRQLCERGQAAAPARPQDPTVDLRQPARPVNDPTISFNQAGLGMPMGQGINAAADADLENEPDQGTQADPKADPDEDTPANPRR